MSHKFKLTFAALALLTLWALPQIFAQKMKPEVRIKPFPKDEQVRYVAHYGLINAGEALISLEENHNVQGHECYKVDVEGRTIGMFALGMKVDDLWRSYIDKRTYMPRKFYRNIKENRYRKVETIYFDQDTGRAYVRSTTGKRPEKIKSYDTPPNVQDMISGYYFLRTLNLTKYKDGDTVKIPAFFEDKNYNFKMVYRGKDRVKTKLGKFDAFRFDPIMPDNSIFDGEDAISLWMSDDEYRVPIKIRAKMFIGAIEIEITDYKNAYTSWEDRDE